MISTKIKSVHYRKVQIDYIMKDTYELLKLAVASLDEKKADDIRVIDISEISVVADYFLIASGSNKSQLQAMSNNVEEKLGRAGMKENHIEGYDTANWILLDFGDIIIHLFDKENRNLYNIERIWRDGKELDIHTLI